MSKPSIVRNETFQTEDRKLERWLSVLLRTGVNLALVLVLSAMAINFFSGQSWLDAPDMNSLLSGAGNLRAEPPKNLAEFFYGFRTLQSLNFVQGAILILILLPGFRLAFMMGSFARQRDWIFTAISFTVLLIMSVGMLLRFAE